MNARCQFDFKNFLGQTHFLACAKTLFLLQAQSGTAMASFRGGEVLAFTSLFERWFLSTDSQAGEFLLRLIGGSLAPSHCGMEAQEPLDTGFNKIIEMAVLEEFA
jgi:hypothetical protein